MRLKSLFIEKYKNIEKQVFDFSNNTGYIALLGLNGSGKSNLIEAICLIFNGLLNNQEIPFYYEIRFEHNGQQFFKNQSEALIDGEKVKESEMVYPSSIIACYSGEDLRLWHLAFENYYLRYFSQAIRNKTFSPRLIYLNRECWKIAFIALLCSEKDAVKSFLRDCLHIHDLTSVNCVFYAEKEKKEKFTEHQALKWFNRIESLQAEDEKGEINANTIRTIDMSMYGVTDRQTNSRFVFQFLYLLSIPELNREKGQDVDKLITNIKITINDIEFDGLSEGEKKMILIECITQVLGDDKSIILLDEPDSHVHVEYKYKLLEAITAFGGQTLFSTHSPLLANHIQKKEKSNIVLLKNGQVVDTDAINKLSAISGEDIDFISCSVVVGSKYILVVEGISDVRCLTKAIEVWSNKDAKYQKLQNIKLLSAGGSGDVKEIFTDVLLSQIEYIDKIVFLFDVDDAGKKGYKKIEDVKQNANYTQYASKIEAIYYNDDLSQNFELEDLFSKEVYEHIVKTHHSLETYREFKNHSQKPVQEIKDHIKEKASSFNDDRFDGFQPVLDRLLTSFNF